MAAVSKNGEALQYASKELRTNSDVVRVAITQTPQAFKWALRVDKNVAIDAVTKNPILLEFLPSMLQSDADVVMAAVTACGEVFHVIRTLLSFALPCLVEDEKFALRLVSQSPMALMHLSHELRANKDVVTAAVLKNPHAMRFAHPSLKSQKRFMMDLATLEPKLLQYGYVTDALRADKDILVTAVNPCTELKQESGKGRGKGKGKGKGKCSSKGKDKGKSKARVEGRD
eukprot:gnl/MRDRNA2_/MRDRNA2_24228_c0_seq1.p1 gnl/MRDRNA2_/MRDRNA2_24228_c0~~gnl/MRDRNA2_/MRDRNA2_24228_c0_seq1.p1  ORF type:complete len:258 (+),score=61.49 gnl/MRDRNA2_/MRDRNA2_24228_c0_seq1:88-774(+)